MLLLRRHSFIFFLQVLTLGVCNQSEAQIQVTYGDADIGGVLNSPSQLSASGSDYPRGNTFARNIFKKPQNLPGVFEEIASATALQDQVGYLEILTDHGVTTYNRSNPFTDGPDPNKRATGLASYHVRYASGWQGVDNQEIGIRVADANKSAVQNMNSGSAGASVSSARAWVEPTMYREVSEESAVHADLVFELRYGCEGTWMTGNDKHYSANRQLDLEATVSSAQYPGFSLNNSMGIKLGAGLTPDWAWRKVNPWHAGELWGTSPPPATSRILGYDLERDTTLDQVFNWNNGGLVFNTSPAAGSFNTWQQTPLKFVLPVRLYNRTYLDSGVGTQNSSSSGLIGNGYIGSTGGPFSGLNGVEFKCRFENITPAPALQVPGQPLLFNEGDVYYTYAQPVVVSYTKAPRARTNEIWLSRRTWNSTTGAWSSMAHFHTYELGASPLAVREVYLGDNNPIGPSDPFAIYADDPADAGIYRIWVRGLNSAGAGPWSAWSEISVGAIPPGVPDVLTPVGSTNVSAPQFKWRKGAGSTSTELWVNRISAPTATKVIYQPALGGSTYNPTVPLSAGTYTTWVRGKNSYGVSANWSTPVDFVVTN